MIRDRDYQRKQARTGLTYLMLIVFLIGALLPFAGIFLTAFKSSWSWRRGPSPCPKRGTDNFQKAWDGARFGTYFRSSVIVVVPVVIIATILSTMSGYAFGMISGRQRPTALIV